MATSEARTLSSLRRHYHLTYSTRILSLLSTLSVALSLDQSFIPISSFPSQD